MCLSCGCKLPANPHGDKRTITYNDYINGDRNFKEAAKHDNSTEFEAMLNTAKTLKLIKKGKLDKSKR